MAAAKRIAKNTFFSFFGTNTTKILTMILTILIARFFTDAEFGRLSFALSFTGLFIILIDLGTRLLLLRDIATDKKNASKYITNVLILKIASSILVFLLIAIIINLMNYPKETITLVYIGALIIIFESLSNSLGSIFQAFEKLKYSAMIKIIRVFLRFVITLPILFLGYGLIYVMLAYLIVQIINIIITITIVQKKFIKLKFKPDLQLMKSFIKRGFPFLLSSAFVMLYFKIDITMLSIIKGDAVVGWYSAAYNLIDAIITIPIALHAALLPVAVIYFKESKEKLIKLYKVAAKLLMSLSFPLTIGGILVAKDLIPFIYGDKYYNSIFAFQILLIVLIPLFIVHLLGAMMIAIKKEKLGVPALFITCISNIILNLILIPKYSFLGAAIATIISEIIYLIMYYYIITKNLEFINLFKLAIKPLISTIIMASLILLQSRLIPNLSFIITIIFGSGIYFLTLYLIKGITKEEKEIIIRIIKIKRNEKIIKKS